MFSDIILDNKAQRRQSVINFWWDIYIYVDEALHEIITAATLCTKSKEAWINAIYALNYRYSLLLNTLHIKRIQQVGFSDTANNWSLQYIPAIIMIVV